jgi:hypothetical protein
MTVFVKLSINKGHLKKKKKERKLLLRVLQGTIIAASKFEMEFNGSVWSLRISVAAARSPHHWAARYARWTEVTVIQDCGNSATTQWLHFSSSRTCAAAAEVAREPCTCFISSLHI